MNISVKKREKSPDYVLGSFGFRLEEIKQYVNQKGWVNGEVLKAKDGNGVYIKISSYGLDNNNIAVSEEEIPF